MDLHAGGLRFSGDTDSYTRLGGRDSRDVLMVSLQVREAASGSRSEPWWGPGMLGSAVWMEDAELIQVLATRPAFARVISRLLAEFSSRRGQLLAERRSFLVPRYAYGGDIRFLRLTATSAGSVIAVPP